MHADTLAAVVLCTGLGTTRDVRPLTPRRFQTLTASLAKHNLSPAALLSLNLSELLQTEVVSMAETTQILALAAGVDRVRQQLKALSDNGIGCVGVAEMDYPIRLRYGLRKDAPPVLFYAGDLSIANQNAVAVVGSRQVGEVGAAFAKMVGGAVAACGLTLVTGAAKGCDTIAAQAALRQGGRVVLFPAVPLWQVLRQPLYRQSLAQNRLCILSACAPDTAFSAYYALTRNRYIYQNANCVFVCESKAGKGGSYSGARQWLARGKAVYVFDHPDCAGNQQLIGLGGLPVPDQLHVVQRLIYQSVVGQDL